MNSQQNSESKKSKTAQSEELILSFWQQHNIFEKSLEKESPQGDFVFYDGPPFATGLPHYGHLLAGTIKDIIPRYKTMQGFSVPRKWAGESQHVDLVALENVQTRKPVSNQSPSCQFRFEKN